MRIRRALAGGLDAVVRLTQAAYAPYAQSAFDMAKAVETLATA
ncbi:hypothetical protein [Mesorhizobium sp.]|nr:hypothetical protein [Mesorhizobium sp.]